MKSILQMMCVFFLMSFTMLAQSAGLRVGAAVADITPRADVLLDGTIMKIGPAKDVHDRLHARCVVFDDGKKRIAIAVMDNTMISREILDDARQQIHDVTGMPKSHILLSATHSHSTPRAIDIQQGPANEEYHLELARQISAGVQEALKNLQPAEIGWGSFDEPRFVFNRRWFFDKKLTHTNPFGGKEDQVWMNPPRGGLVKAAGPVDSEVFVVGARQVDGTPIFLLGNYGLHYIGGVPGGHISADYFGVFSERVKELLGQSDQEPAFVGLMSNGTSGDVNAVNFQAERKRYPPYVRMKEVGQSLADQATKVFKETSFSNEARIAVAYEEISLGVRKPDAKRLAWAKETLAKAKPTGRPTRPVIYAREALGLSEYPDEVKIVLQVFRIGDLAIAAIPNEVFAETGLAIKEQSPFKDTFIIELANGYSGYLPTAKQHEWGGYETWPARSSLLEVGAESKIRATIIRLLKEVE
ncbi:neutral/alkaline non-lysosomal ceramidase N-terminal domain-containing protein [Verrucomicrobia bacterium]|nr:neutral/alkaline non-lysosomal ceramidase N-terminal domain-containing protein [Verrucomicrobiota bacterium]